MGEGLGRPLIAYLDTNVVLWLAAGDLPRITPVARQVIQGADLLISPMVQLELQYLFEVGRSVLSSSDILFKARHDLAVDLCDLPFPLVAEAAIDENWTREPFDRLIVAQAKANGFAPLVTADTRIREHYPRAVW